MSLIFNLAGVTTGRLTGRHPHLANNLKPGLPPSPPIEKMLDDCELAEHRLTEGEQEFLGVIRERHEAGEIIPSAQIDQLMGIWERRS
jgi:hypothetical protein